MKEISLKLTGNTIAIITPHNRIMFLEPGQRTWNENGTPRDYIPPQEIYLSIKDIPKLISWLQTLEDCST